MSNHGAWAQISETEVINGPAFEVTRETFREFAEASADFAPLHLDDSYMGRAFCKTQFGGIIAHGMTSALITPRDDWMRTPGTINAG